MEAHTMNDMTIRYMKTMGPGKPGKTATKVIPGSTVARVKELVDAGTSEWEIKRNFKKFGLSGLSEGDLCKIIEQLNESDEEFFERICVAVTFNIPLECDDLARIYGVSPVAIVQWTQQAEDKIRNHPLGIKLYAEIRS
jgi:hypothetical protein